MEKSFSNVVAFVLSSLLLDESQLAGYMIKFQPITTSPTSTHTRNYSNKYVNFYLINKKAIIIIN